MYNTSLIKKTLLAATLVFLYSCDKDFNSIGDDIFDNHFDIESKFYDVNAYNQKVTPVASNNLLVNALGIYDNPAFGVTTASFNTQVSLPNNYGPKLGVDVVIDSITLNIPYFSTVKTQNTDGSKTYVLDSIYGPESGRLKLSVYESGIFLNDYKPNDATSKFYYTNKSTEFQQQVIGARLNNSANLSENDSFFFNSKEIKEVTPKTETTAENITWVKPEMRLHLDTTFFKNKIFNAPAEKLGSDDVFKNYFRGLYFQVENSGNSPGRMAMLNFAEGKIKIFYKAKDTDESKERTSKILEIKLIGNTTSLLNESNAVANYTTATANDQIPDEKLYLKGGEGSMAMIELSGLSNELDEIRKNITEKYWKVNEANLIFYVDETEMNKAGVVPPKRIYLYDATNNTPVRDYLSDGSTGRTTKNNKLIFDGKLQKITQNNITSTIYKIRITDHMRNLLSNNTATNIKLGLVVTEDIMTSSFSIMDPTMINNSAFKAVPTASVMNPLGTVLFGGTPASGDKKVKLQIYYTKPN